MHSRIDRSVGLSAGIFLTALLCLQISSGQQQVQAGWALLTGPQRAEVAATALFSFRNETGVLVSEAGVPAVRPLRSGRIYVDQRGRRTALALVNPAAGTVEVEFLLRDPSGAPAGSTRRSFAPGQHRALFVDELFSGLEPGRLTNFLGSLSFAAETEPGLAAVAIRVSQNRHGEPLLATLPVLDEVEDPDRLIFPQVGAGPGLSTELVLVGAGDRVRGRIRLVGSDGGPLVLRLHAGSRSEAASEFDYEVPPDGVFRGQFQSQGELRSGYAVVEIEPGPGRLTGVAVFQFWGAAGDLVTEAGIPASPGSTLQRIFLDQAATRTGLAVAASGSAPGEVVFRLLDRQGALLDEEKRALAAGGHLALFADELFRGLPQGLTAILEIRSPIPLSAVTLKLSVNSRGEPVLTALPVARAGALVDFPLIFPQVGFGLGFQTRLILLDLEPEKDLVGTLSFFHSDGVPLETVLGGVRRSSFGYTVPAGGGRQFRPGNSAAPSRIVADLFHPAGNEIAVNKGSGYPLQAAVLDNAGNWRDDFPLLFATTNQAVATVDSLGRVRGIGIGYTTLAVRLDESLAALTVTVPEVEALPGGGGFTVGGVAQDLAGRVFLTNSAQHTVLLSESFQAPFRVHAGVPNRSGLRDGSRSMALFRNPRYLALNQGSGDLLVSDSANHVIRRILPGPDGQVTTLAGTGRPGSADGQLETAQFQDPRGLALDQQGRLWLIDSGNHTVRRLDLSSGLSRTLAGRPGQAGEADGAGAEARFRSPQGVALEILPLAVELQLLQRGEPLPPPSLIVADTGNGRLRRVTEDGVVQTLGAPSPAPQTSAAPASQSKETVQPYRFEEPSGVAVDPFGNIFVAETSGARVRLILPGGALVEAAQAGSFTAPRDLSIQRGGRLLVAEQSGPAREIVYGRPSLDSISPQRVRSAENTQVTIRGRNFAPETVVIVGSGVIIPRRDDTETLRFQVQGLDSGRSTITVQNRGGLAQSFLDVEPESLEALPPGHVTTIAGGTTFAGEGAAAVSVPLSPRGIALDSLGHLYLADFENHKVRRVDSRTGTIETVAGNGRDVESGDGAPAAAAGLRRPVGVGFDCRGNLYTLDIDGASVRRVDAATGLISTVAGGERGSCVQAAPGSEVCFEVLTALAVTCGGDLFFSDSSAHRVWKAASGTGALTILAGRGEAGQIGDGGPAVQAFLNRPFGLALDEANGRWRRSCRWPRRRRTGPSGPPRYDSLDRPGCGREPVDCRYGECPGTQSGARHRSDSEGGGRGHPVSGRRPG